MVQREQHEYEGPGRQRRDRGRGDRDPYPGQGGGWREFEPGRRYDTHGREDRERERLQERRGPGGGYPAGAWNREDEYDRERGEDWRFEDIAEDHRHGQRAGMARHGGSASYGRMEGPHRGKGPRGYARGDDRIREDVCSRLTDDAHLDASEIEVEVKDGEVTLSGTVCERADKRHAEDIADAASGVKHVQNNLRVKPASQTGEDDGADRQSGTGQARAGKRA